MDIEWEFGLLEVAIIVVLFGLPIEINLVSLKAKLDFVDGKLKLKLENGQFQTITDPSVPAVSASMLDSGNFVLYNQYRKIVWQSFASPTDTILGGQNLESGKELISSVSPVNHSAGKFRLKMQYDGNLVAYPVNTVDDSVDAYWNTRTVRNTQTRLFLSNDSGVLELIDNASFFITYVATPLNITYVATPLNSITNSSIYRAVLGYDGNFRLFSHIFDAENSSKVLTGWEAIADICDVKGFCGLNSYCTRIDSEPHCICIPGFDFMDINENTGGCERNFTSARCIEGREDTTLSNMTSMNLDWEDRAYFLALMPEREDCTNSCLEDCDCDAALYSNSYCSKYKLPLKYLKNTTASAKSSTAFFKLNNDIRTIPKIAPEKQPWATILALSLSFLTYSCIVLGFFGIFVFKFHIMKYRNLLLETRTTGLIKEFTLRTYTYHELQKATKDFKQELGKGSFGAVHKGSFDKGKSFVAVKRLEKVVEESRDGTRKQT